MSKIPSNTPSRVNEKCLTKARDDLFRDPGCYLTRVSVEPLEVRLVLTEEWAQYLTPRRHREYRDQARAAVVMAVHAASIRPVKLAKLATALATDDPEPSLAQVWRMIRAGVTRAIEHSGIEGLVSMGATGTFFEEAPSDEFAPPEAVTFGMPVACSPAKHFTQRALRRASNFVFKTMTWKLVISRRAPDFHMGVAEGSCWRWPSYVAQDSPNGDDRDDAISHVVTIVRFIVDRLDDVLIRQLSPTFRPEVEGEAADEVLADCRAYIQYLVEDAIHRGGHEALQNLIT